ncbi:MAG: tRNA (adenosine(37)-N6)-dimethylallyltransferase MiaA [Candidatus Eisenbacteria bacterium]|nr:tRNA (adenosine(37)-N6)-dimethylallyltransferase MiaA [Candidatus Eisenbacteria bacterium]
MRRPLLAVVGPTASGKTETAILLAGVLGGEIVSVDARQVYRGLDIGTAKPTPEERSRAPHHMIDVADPEETFHAARYARLADRAIGEIRERGNLPVLAGGTGLYLRALLRGLDLPVGRDETIRRELKERIAREGSEALHRELARVDPESARVIHRNDAIRIVRALEVHRLTGEPRSLLHKGGGRRHACLTAGLMPPRDLLYGRIDARFDRMMEEGLWEETKSLLDKGLDPDLPCFRSPGYREVIAAIRGRMTREEAVERAKAETRRYAKRQITWFRKEEIFWVDPEEAEGAEGAARRIREWYEREEAARTPS